MNRSYPSEQGWTSQPAGRGTLGIIWPCCMTVFLCCWTSLCLNVPPPDWNRWRRIHQKIIIACMSGLGPEFTFQLALGQWSSARRSVKEFAGSGYTEWSLTHAFFADMGGFILRPPDWVEFPINAKQVHYLVTKGYIPFSDVAIEKAVISDKNKRDSLTRVLTVCQILWFSINCMARLVNGIGLTTMELSVVAFLFCGLGTYACWARKPMDVITPIKLTPNATLTEILVRAGDCAREPYRCTPMDFVGRECSSWHMYWTYWMDIARKLRLAFPLKRAPISSIPDDNFPPISDRASVILFLFQITYAGIHLLAWNFHFPTTTECLLWRIATSYIACSIVAYWIVEFCVWRFSPTVQRSLHALGLPAECPFSFTRGPDMEKGRKTTRLGRKARRIAGLRNYSARKYDRQMEIPLKALIPVTFLGFGYCVARAYILLESWMNLRALPLNDYQTVEWSLFFPHVQ